MSTKTQTKQNQPLIEPNMKASPLASVSSTSVWREHLLFDSLVLDGWKIKHAIHSLLQELMLAKGQSADYLLSKLIEILSPLGQLLQEIPTHFAGIVQSMEAKPQTMHLGKRSGQSLAVTGVTSHDISHLSYVRDTDAGSEISVLTLSTAHNLSS